MDMNEMPLMKKKERKGTHADQSEHLLHKFVTIRHRQRAVAVRMRVLNGLDDRSTRRRLDQRRCAIRLRLRHDRRWRFAIRSVGDGFARGVGFVVAGRRRCRGQSSIRR